MSTSVIFSALLAIVCGGFFCAYGYTLFRFVLAAVGLLIGYSIGASLAASQPDFMRIVIGIVIGAIGAGALYALVSVSLYLAGGILGLVVALLVISLFNIPTGFISLLLLLAGVGLIGYFGRMLGDLIIIVATAAVGAYSIVYGLSQLFPDYFGGSQILDGRIPISSFTLSLLLSIGLISGFAQFQILTLRRRLRLA